MWYGGCKVYNDGSHFIAIPHTTRPTKKRPKLPEEVITVIQEDVEGSVENTEPSCSFEEAVNIAVNEQNDCIEEDIGQTNNKPKMAKKLTKREYFNELYKEYIFLSRKERRKNIINKMLPYFENSEYCVAFVEVNLERKYRNLVCRRVRMSRKANLAHFNYFVTFTYDNEKHNEISFRKHLKIALQNLSTRKGWKYMGVWERAPETKRLHFHGLFHIPAGTMPGFLEEHSDYSFSEHRRIKTYQNTFFNEKFGRSDFKQVVTQADVSQEITYIMKYIEKSEEKIVYSKGLYQYFISDILEDDIVCTIGQEDKKLLLFDDFMCLDEGCLIGKVSPEVIEQMQKCNS